MDNIKKMPWWLKLFVQSEQWVTIYPNIYTDMDPEKYPHLVLHERVHLLQQKSYGKWKWLWRYMTNKTFRLFEEAEAIVSELDSLDEATRHQRYEWYLTALTGRFYLYCAADRYQASIAILNCAGKKRFGV